MFEKKVIISDIMKYDGNLFNNLLYWMNEQGKGNITYDFTGDPDFPYARVIGFYNEDLYTEFCLKFM